MKKLGMVAGLMAVAIGVMAAALWSDDAPKRPKISGIAFVRIKITDGSSCN